MANGRKENLNNDNSFTTIYKEHLSKQIIFIALVVIGIIFLLNKINIIAGIIKKIVSILMPIIIGFVLSYLVTPLYQFVITFLGNEKEIYFINKSHKMKMSKVVATATCTIFVIVCAIGLVFLFVPQLFQSIKVFLSRSQGYLDSLQKNFQNMKDTANNQLIVEVFNQIDSFFKNYLVNESNTLMTDYANAFSSISNGVSVAFKIILNCFVGLVVMIYTLNMKVEFSTGAKRMLFAFFNEKTAKKILEECRFANTVFSGFISGKIVDSVIIGVICYVCCLIMKMPYTPLISVIVGITNIIPFFGPFIGAIPAFLIIFLDQPMTWRPYGFLVFILILQQIDGNIIGPKILGDKTGVGSFWVLFSILLFGGLFGFVGMIIAVPLWAIITKLVEEYVVSRLKEKNYPLTVDDYAKTKEKNGKRKK